MPRPLFTLPKDPVLIVQNAGWAPGPVWTNVENLAPTRIRSPDHPAHSQLLYRLSYPAHNDKVVGLKKMGGKKKGGEKKKKKGLLCAVLKVTCIL
jgi:hypothetical protein